MAERARVGSMLSRTFALTARNAAGLFGLAFLFAGLTRTLDWAAFGADPFVFLPVPRSADPLLAVMLQQCADQLIQFGANIAMLWLLLSATISHEAQARDDRSAVGPLATASLILWGASSVGFVLQYAMALLPFTSAKLVVALGSIAWGIAALYAIFGLWVTTPVVIAERLGAIAAFRRSWTLTKGHRGAIFGIAFILLAGIGVPMLLLRSVGGYHIAPPLPIPLWSPVGVVSLLLQQTLIVLMAASTVVIYWELRKAKDGMLEEDVFA